MGVSIKETNMNLNSINKTATELGLQKILADAPTAPYAGMETDAFSADPIFIGRDEVVSEIVETLITSIATHHQRVFSILPIVGMGGLGKTTLTRNVFHHQKMKTQIGSRIWVHVSQVFDLINLFNKILQELTSSQSGQGESRQEILKRLQEDKTYLLVLDDVWNEDVSKWENFLNSLSGVTNTKGNGIIVTTRNTKVASIVGTLPVHQLKALSEEDCWSIIRAKTFLNLRHLHVPSYVELPAEIGRLTSLQTLQAEFIVRDKNGYKIEELGSLNNLKGSLTIRGLEKVHNKEEAEKANLSNKSKLSELLLIWDDNREEVESINDENPELTTTK